MSKEDLLKKLEAIFQDTLENPAIRLNFHTTANDIAEWDSVTHLVLLHAIEQELHVHFTIDEVMHFQNVGDICTCIASNH
jgi:acyl carrier protein